MAKVSGSLARQEDGHRSSAHPGRSLTRECNAWPHLSAARAGLGHKIRSKVTQQPTVARHYSNKANFYSTYCLGR